MTESIISNEQVCFRCGTPLNIHLHHIYGGSGRRKLSDKYGCWVYLCARHHNMSDEGVHFNKEFDTELKQLCQMEWEQRFGSRDDFRHVFGRSYL